MSVIGSGPVRIQQFFRSAPMPCPYRPGQTERKLFARLEPEDASRVNSRLTRAGFRRSHDIVYRPICPTCNACVPVRIPTARLVLNRTMRRLQRRNADLIASRRPARSTPEQFELFRRYQFGRHMDGEMAAMTRADYAAMIQDGGYNSELLELRTAEGRLIGVMLLDWVEDGASAIYSFFDPREERRSLGIELILRSVAHVEQAGLDNLYLGYWIGDCAKMAYKARFRPLEQLVAGGWREFDPDQPFPSG